MPGVNRGVQRLEIDVQVGDQGDAINGGWGCQAGLRGQAGMTSPLRTARCAAAAIGGCASTMRLDPGGEAPGPSRSRVSAAARAETARGTGRLANPPPRVVRSDVTRLGPERFESGDGGRWRSPCPPWPRFVTVAGCHNSPGTSNRGPAAIYVVLLCLEWGTD